MPLSSAVFLIVCSSLPAEFFSVDAGGLTWTLDRLWFLVLMAQCVVLWYRGERTSLKIETTDLILGAFVLWLAARTLTQPFGAVVKYQPHTLLHFINGYLVPVAVLVVLRLMPLKTEHLKPAVGLLAVFGLYLSFTAVCEITKQWQFVFPKFIADGTIGIHFGRARGPMLQSVRLGVCLLLILMIWPVATIWLKPRSKTLWIATAVIMPALLLALFLTYTRSIWMGAALIMGVLILGCLEGITRRAAICSIAGAAVLGVAIKGPDLVAFKREYSAAETRESTYMRAAFAYVSWKMFQDKPVAGFGFNQFQVYNRPYLADRSTDIRLESIRGYVHHNSFLSLLVDLGLVGFVLYMTVLVAFARRAWSIWRHRDGPQWSRGVGLITLGVLGVHLIQMAFHEVSFSTIENVILYAMFGLTATCYRQFVAQPAAVPASSTVQLTSSETPRPEPSGSLALAGQS
ncbi:MAG: O-antigen ligase family protein [Pirellulales bacterium]